MDDIVKGEPRALEERVEGFRGGEVYDDSEVYFAFPVGVRTDNVLCFFLGPHCGSDGVFALRSIQFLSLSMR